MLRRLILIVGLIFIFISSSYALVSSTVDRNEIGLDDILTLTITSDEQLSGKPDWQLLAKDFQVISTSQQSQLSIMNGKMSSRVSWVVSLMPRNSGTITIPSFQIGNSRTQPLVVKVSDFGSPTNSMQTAGMPSPAHSASFNVSSPKQKTTNLAKDIFMEVNVNPRESYVQQQLTYSVKLFFKRKIDEAFLMGPSLPNATVVPIGEDIYYSTVKKGQFYRVLERSFVIFPQQSGDYDITPAVLTGVIEREPGDIFDFGNFMAGYTRENIKISAPKIRVSIKNKPAAFDTQWWLPAKHLTLKETWQPSRRKIHVGDPITREITIQAVGLKGDALPKIEVTPTNDLNVYSEPTVTKTETDDQNLIGSLKQKIVMVPTQSGIVKIPEIKLPWWNTTTNSMQMLHLPEHTITVLAASGVTNKLPTQVSPGSFSSTPTDQSSFSFENILDFLYRWSLLFYITLGIIGFGLVTIFWLRRKKRAKPTVAQPTAPLKINKYNTQDLHQACGDNNPRLAKQLLLKWARDYWPDQSFVSLFDIVKQLQKVEGSNNLQHHIQELDRFLYTDQNMKWQGKVFWQVFVLWIDEHRSGFVKQKSQPGQDLPPLYLD